jgi:phosphonate transport system permease protein
VTEISTDAVKAFEIERKRFLARRRIEALVGVLAFSALLALSFQRSEFFAADIGGDPLGRIGEFLGRMVPDLKPEALLEDRRAQGSLAWWYYDLPVWLRAGWQTVEMAIVATTLGAVGACLAGFATARNLMPFAPVRFAVRRMLELIRTLPDLIVALILVAAFGVGPLAGVITLALSTFGSLGKLFAEVNEEVDRRPLEALDASGAGLARKIRYGVLPQVLPNYASYALLRLEGNVAGAAALGIVGAGGIGVELQRAITYTEFDTYLAILLMIVAMIFLIDIASEQIRHRLIGLGAQR